VGLVEPNPPTPFVLPDPGDNLDAVDVDTTLADVMGPIYISLDSAFPDPLEGPGTNTGTAVANGFVGGDVLVTSAGGLPALYAPAPVLGLDVVPGAGPDSDDLDALALFESGDGVFTPGVDLIFYSVRRGSAVIGAPDSIFGAPISEGDILVPPAIGGLSPFPGIWVAAEALGLWTFRSFGASEFGPFSDDLDALDVVPEPSTVSLLVLGSLCLLGYAWRRRRQPAA